VIKRKIGLKGPVQLFIFLYQIFVLYFIFILIISGTVKKKDNRDINNKRIGDEVKFVLGGIVKYKVIVFYIILVNDE
jgi:hypothetical protein